VKAIILDKLRRLKLVWIAVCILSMCVGGEWVEMTAKTGTSTGDSWWLIFYAALLPFLLLELNRGYARVALTLPFTARQLGRLLWLISVGMPTVIVAFFGGLGVLLGGLANSVPANRLPVLWVGMVLLAGLLLGSGFWLLNCFPTSDSKGKASRRWMGQTYGNIVVGALIVFGYWLCQASYSPGTKYGIGSLLALLFTSIGWYRSGGLLVESSERRRGASEAEKRTWEIKSSVGNGGLWGLLGRMVMGQFAVVLFSLVAVVIWSVWESHGANWLVTTKVWLVTLYVCGAIAIGQSAQLAGQPRTLRILPLTGKQIAGLLLLTALVPFLLAGLIISVFVGLSGGVPMGISVCKASFMGLAPLCVLTVALVWNTEEPMEKGVVMLVLVGLSSVAPVYQLFAREPGLPVPFVVTYPLLFLVVAFWVLMKLIERNDLTYHARDGLGGKT